MKKKILTGVTIFALLFILGGIYLATSIEKGTSELSTLIKLHQVEQLRENLLIQLKRVQFDLNLKNTRYARGFGTIVNDIRLLQKSVDKCSNCHHSGKIKRTLTGIREDIKAYKEQLSRVLTISANAKRLQEEMDSAFSFGESLSVKVNTMVNTANMHLSEKTESTLSGIRKSKGTIFSMIGVGTLLILLLSYTLIKNFTQSVDTLLAATKSIKGGDLSYRIEGLKDEFGEVANSFNEMSVALKQQMKKMQRTEQMVVFGEYAAKLAHEIKSPLSGIKVTLEVLPRKLNLTEEDRSLLGKITSEIGRIESLLDSLLDYAKPPKPHFMPVEVSQILNSAINFSHKRHGLSAEPSEEKTITMEIDENLPRMKADPMQLQQIFLNLINNAMESMSGEGRLSIRATCNRPANIIEIELSDTGEGIDEKALKRIFEPFFTTKPKGTGLGLPITSQLVRQNGGTIEVESKRDEGTTFRITFPAHSGEKE